MDRVMTRAEVDVIQPPMKPRNEDLRSDPGALGPSGARIHPRPWDWRRCGCRGRFCARASGSQLVLLGVPLQARLKHFD